MKFSDNIQRRSLDTVFVKRSESAFQNRDEINSNLWDIEKYGIAFDKKTCTQVHLYSTPVRDVKIGENIYNKKGKFIAYRTN